MTLPTDRINPPDFRLKRVLDDATVLKAQIDDLARTVADLRSQLDAERAARVADRAALTDLQARFARHVHRLRGQVGQGFITGRIDGLLRKFLIPAETEEARRSLATTNPPEG